MSISPSALQKAFLPIDILARYMCTARPSCKVGSPFPATVFIPSTKSTNCSPEGMSKGCQAN
ncbi:hypothetical protein HHX47_DHR7000765 [Lentinula edodes]|nr:hypothetical protein HHX47_DHR7000765 [Lentinula edodes]